MASIGAVSCTFVKGASVDKTEELETWRTPGYDGFGVHALGKGQSRFRFRATEFAANVSAAETWYGSLEAIVGTTVDITDDFNVVHQNCMIQSLSQPVRRPAYTPSATSQVRYEAEVIGVRL